MKRLYTFIPALLLICILSLLTFSACSSENNLAEDKLTEFKQKLLAENNYQITLTIENVPLFGTLRDNKKIDGNISYGKDSFALGEPRYIEETDSDKFEYTQLNDKWYKTVLTEDSDNYSELDYIKESIDTIFNINNYIKTDENIFELKEGVEYYILGPIDENDYSIESAIVTVNEDDCVFEMEAFVSSIYYKMTLVFSDIGNINLTLPEVS